MTDDIFSGGDDAKADLSPMIDLVFLLLIFFIVTAQIVQYKKDPNIQMPKASSAKIPDDIKDRLVVNVYQDGTIKDENGTIYSLSEFEELVRQTKSQEPNTKLLVRADARVDYMHIRKVSARAGLGGIPNIIYASKD